MGVTRRELLAEAVWASMGASLVVLAGCGRRTGATRGGAGETAPPAFFSMAEMVTLAAACERLLPRDEDPGAIDLGVPGYVDAALAEEAMTSWREPMRAGLADLDARARASARTAFHLATSAEQDEILTAVQNAGEAGDFFARLINLTLEGAFGDPVHGGNRDRAGWQLVGFAGDACAPRAPVVLGRRS